MADIAPYAALPEHSKGRYYEENRGAVRGPRSIFQRDRDRIIHSIAFRRLRNKTQVFTSPNGDHFRVRLTHSLEVAQIGRTIARELGLNEDLTEALCLAHDIGHPPFGHAGEDALQEKMAQFGGFDHNANTLRQTWVLESPYPRYCGLNLCWEVMEGLAKHNGPVSNPNWALREIDEKFPLALHQWPTLEAQVAAIADDIAYDNHDIDDGLRSGFLKFSDIADLPFVAEQWEKICDHFSDCAPDMLHRELVRSQIGVMVNDVIVTTRENIAQYGIKSSGDAHLAGRMIAGFSPEMTANERSLKKRLYARLYHHEEQKLAARQAHMIIAALFDILRENPEYLPAKWARAMPETEPLASRHIADYIAGMTDRFALQLYEKLTGQVVTELIRV